MDNFYGSAYRPYGYGNPYMQNQPQFQPQPQVQYQPNVALNFIGSEEEARAFIMQPNTTIYFLDSNTMTFYEKKSDTQCRTTLSKFALVKDEPKQEVSNENDFKAILDTLNDKVDKLSKIIENSLGMAKNEVIEDVKQ